MNDPAEQFGLFHKGTNSIGSIQIWTTSMMILDLSSAQN